MKSKIFLLFFSILIVSNSFAQEDEKHSHFAFGLGSNFWLQSKDYAFSPKHYKGELHGFTAIPVSQFTIKNRSTIFSQLNLYASIIWMKEFHRGQFVNVELGCAQSAISGDNGIRMRYTDMIDKEGRGFVMTSSFTLKEYQAATQYMFVRPKLQFALNSFGIEQKVGVGLLGYLIMRSNYSLHMQLHGGENFYYKETDLKISDFVWQVVPEISYQAKLTEYKQHQISFNTSLSWRAPHFTQRAMKTPKTYFNDIWTTETVKPILSLGLIIEQKNAT